MKVISSVRMNVQHDQNARDVTQNLYKALSIKKFLTISEVFLSLNTVL